MKTLKAMGCALGATLALGALAAASASAEPIEWLKNGASLTSPAATETSGELEITDTKTSLGEASILCSVDYAGNVAGPGATEGELTKLLNLSNEETGELGGLGIKCLGVKICEAEGAEEWAVLLPWGRHMLLKMTTWLQHILRPGTMFKCLVLGVTVEDECTDAPAEEDITDVVTNVMGGVEDTYSKAISEEEGAQLGSCTLGGAKSEVITGKLLTKLTGEGTLAVSD